MEIPRHWRLRKHYLNPNENGYRPTNPFSQPDVKVPIVPPPTISWPCSESDGIVLSASNETALKANNR
jgi:hypothetical protein